MSFKLTSISAIALLTVACSNADKAASMSPDQTYQAYKQLLVDGMNFEDSKKYHSNAMTAKVEKQVVAMQKNSEKSAEAILTFFTQMNSQIAKCSELTLASETIDGTTANLVYDRKDICGDGGFKAGGEKIRMVYEDGWKIDDNLSVY